MIVLIILVFLPIAGGESFQGNVQGHVVEGTRKFEAPDIDMTGNGDFEPPPQLSEWNHIESPPQLSEWNHKDPELQRRLIVFGSGNSHISIKSQQASEVASMTREVCRKCMIAGDIKCVSQLCMVESSIAEIPKKINVQHKAFATGAALQGDILCSLCKHARDVTCTMRLCADPERDKNARESGVECMQGFCRWQKETVISSGFGNSYSGWWQPQSLYLWFDQVTKELAVAYHDFYSVTSKAVNILG